MIDRPHRRGGQLGHDLFHQRAEASLDPRVLIQQIRESASPPLRLGYSDSLQLTTRRLGHKFVRLRQPLFRDPNLSGIPTAQQPRELTPDQLPHIGDRRSRHSLTSPLRQRH